MNIERVSFQRFLDNYCKQELNDIILTQDNSIDSNGLKCKKYVYETPDYVSLELKDIIPQQNTSSTPVFILNLQEELRKNNIDDQLINHLISSGFRVIFTQNNFYSKKNLDKEFILKGLDFWKINIASQMICINYVKDHIPLNNINIISISGLNSSIFTALVYYDIPCNQIHAINGFVDFNQLIDNGDWDKIFSVGVYAGFNQQAVRDNIALQYLNPSRLFADLNAKQKFYYSTNTEEHINNATIKTYHNLKDLQNRLYESIGA